MKNPGKLFRLLVWLFLISALLAAPAAATPAEELDALLVQAFAAYEKGDYERARDLFQQAAELSTKTFGPEHKDTLSALHNLAATYQTLGDHQKASELKQQVLETRQRRLELLPYPHNPYILSTLREAHAAFNQEKYERARDLYQQAAELSTKTFGPEHQDTLSALHRLANTYYKLGDYQKALELNQQTLETWQRLLGPEHPYTLDSQNDLANTYDKLGDYQKALGLKRQVWEARQRSLGPEHQYTLRALENLANTYGELGDYQKVLELKRQVWEARQRVLGPEHPYTLSALHNLANTYDELGDYQKVLELRRQVWEAERRVLGFGHPDTLGSLHNLAKTYSDLGEYQKALEVRRQVWEFRQRSLGPEHPVTLGALHNLADSYDDLGDYQKALELSRQVWEASQRVLGPEHLDTLRALHSLANSYDALGDHQKALELRRQVWEAIQRVLGPEHPDTLRALRNLANSYGALGDHLKALELNQQALETWQRVLGPEHPDTLMSLHNLASSYIISGDNQKALESYYQAFVGLSKKLGLYHPDTAITAMNMAEGFKKTRQLKSAIFYARLAVEAAQRQRGAHKALERELQASYLATVEERYQLLAAWLIEAGRPEEALAVLRLLKEDEFSEMTRAAAEGQPETRADSADPLQARLAELGAALAEADAALEELKKKEEAGGPVPEKAAAETRLAEAGRAFQAYLDQLPGLLARPDRASPYQEAARRNLEDLKAITRNLGPAAAIIHTLSAEDALHLFLTTEDGLVSRQSPVGLKEMEGKVAALQPLLRSPGLDPRPAAQDIYRAVLEPLKGDLAGAKTLMFSVDGALRYIPLAALYDGEKWLPENYAVVIFTEAARDKLTAKTTFNVQAAGLGLTEAKDDLAALPAVKDELNDIVKFKGEKSGVLPGVKYLNDQFNYKTLSASLREGREILHLASHFVFRPTDPNMSYLLLGDGSRLTLLDINQDNDLPFDKLDLLTLSACETAVGLARGNGREVEGLAALAQTRGAATVLATLWPIADESTGRLMADFYRLRYDEKQTKAEALRQAQLNLMQGRSLTAADQAQTRGKAKVVSSLVKEGQAVAAKPWTGEVYAHPYFWAPFILMGNWK